MDAKSVIRNLFVISCIAIALLSWRMLVYSVEAISLAMVAQEAANRVLFYMHIVFAPLALALLPFQFNQRLRRRHLSVHRWTGRFYVISVFFGSLGGLSMGFSSNSGAFAASGFITLAVLWFLTTFMAVAAIREKRIEDHKAWMIRSAALGFGAVTLRIYVPIGFIIEGHGLMPVNTFYPIMSWLAWLPNLVVVEYWMSGKRQVNRETIHRDAP